MQEHDGDGDGDGVCRDMVFVSMAVELKSVLGAGEENIYLAGRS